jgi:hypothetical protein
MEKTSELVLVPEGEEVKVFGREVGSVRPDQGAHLLIECTAGKKTPIAQRLENRTLQRVTEIRNSATLIAEHNFKLVIAKVSSTRYVDEHSHRITAVVESC